MGEAVNVSILVYFRSFYLRTDYFPRLFSFGVEPNAGPPLIFITLPNIFNAMSGGRIWGTLFFLCMFFAAASTIIAVFENIITFAMELTGCSRRKSVICNLIAILVLSVPCILGFNVWSGISPLGAGKIFWILKISW